MTSGRPEVSPLPADAIPTAGAGHNPADATLSEALLTVRKRKYLIAAITALGISYGFYKGTTQPRLYQATGTIEIRTGSSNQFRVNGNSNYGSGSSSLQTQVAIIKSDTVLLTVARDLDLPNNAAFTGYYGPNRHLSLDDLNVRQGTLNGMNAEIGVGIVPKTDLVQISCETLDPKLSADIVNRLIREFIQRDLQSSYEATQRVSDFLSLQLRDLKQEVETQQEQLIDLQKRIGVLGFDPQHNQIQSTLDDLTRAVSAAQIARIQQQARFKTLNTMNPDALDGTIGAQSAGGLSTSLSGLRATREGLLAQYAELNASLGTNHPQVKALTAQIDEINKQIVEEQKRLLDQAHEAYVAANDNEQQTRGALEVEKAEAYKLRDDLVEYTLRHRGRSRVHGNRHHRQCRASRWSHAAIALQHDACRWHPDADPRRRHHLRSRKPRHRHPHRRADRSHLRPAVAGSHPADPPHSRRNRRADAGAAKSRGRWRSHVPVRRGLPRAPYLTASVCRWPRAPGDPSDQRHSQRRQDNGRNEPRLRSCPTRCSRSAHRRRSPSPDCAPPVQHQWKGRPQLRPHRKRPTPAGRPAGP